MKEFIFALALTTSSALTANAADVTGTYSGMLLVNGLPQPVWVELKNVSPGNDGNYIKYSKPRNCYLEYEFGGKVGDEYVFYLDGYGSGWCHEISNNKQGILKIKALNGRDLQYEIYSDGQITENMTVQKQ